MLRSHEIGIHRNRLCHALSVLRRLVLETFLLHGAASALVDAYLAAGGCVARGSTRRSGRGALMCIRVRLANTHSTLVGPLPPDDDDLAFSSRLKALLLFFEAAQSFD